MLSGACFAQAVREAISTPEIPQESKLRLAVLYALRYQKLPGNQVDGVVDLLKQQGVPDHEASLVIRVTRARAR